MAPSERTAALLLQLVKLAGPVFLSIVVTTSKRRSRSLSVFARRFWCLYLSLCGLCCLAVSLCLCCLCLPTSVAASVALFLTVSALYSPMSVAMLHTALPMVTLYRVGRLSKENLAAAALGNMLCNATAYATGFGLSSSLGEPAASLREHSTVLHDV